jgi:hypothetical protein
VSQSLAVAGWIVAMMAALTAIGVSGRWLWRTGANLTRLMDALLGEPPSPAAPEGRPGIIQRQAKTDEAVAEIKEAMRSMSDRLAFVEEQLRPNGGTSLRDTVQKIADNTVPPG